MAGVELAPLEPLSRGVFPEGEKLCRHAKVYVRFSTTNQGIKSARLVLLDLLGLSAACTAVSETGT